MKKIITIIITIIIILAVLVAGSFAVKEVYSKYSTKATSGNCEEDKSYTITTQFKDLRTTDNNGYTKAEITINPKENTAVVKPFKEKDSIITYDESTIKLRHFSPDYTDEKYDVFLATDDSYYYYQPSDLSSRSALYRTTHWKSNTVVRTTDRVSVKNMKTFAYIGNYELTGCVGDYLPYEDGYGFYLCLYNLDNDDYYEVDMQPLAEALGLNYDEIKGKGRYFSTNYFENFRITAEKTEENYIQLKAYYKGGKSVTFRVHNFGWCEII